MKQSIDQLAILGGQPEFKEPFYVGRPNIGDKTRLMQRIEDIIDRRWLTNDGVYVQEFERKLCQITGARHCIPMCNATVALEIAIRAAGLKGEVIVPSFTFIATAHSLQWQEITPVFCDIDPATHNLDPKCVERMITPRTTGIVGVHLWGRACDVEALEDIAKRRNLKLLFDAAHAFGSSHKGKMIGNFGDAEVMSFHATKFLNTFEGGAVVTNNDELAAKIRLMKNFGFSGYDNVIYIGTNGKMNELSAAMGVTSLESMDDFIATNKRNYELYREKLKGAPGLKVISYPERDRSNYQYVIVEVDPERSAISRDHLVEVLHAENVFARRYFFPGCHRMEPYRSYFPHSGLLLPETERLCKSVMALPTGTAVSSDEINAICALVNLAVAHGPALTDRLCKIKAAKELRK